MKNIKIVSLNFDTRTKCVMFFCIVIAICIISYSFYVVCIKHGGSNTTDESGLEYYLTAKGYEAKFEVCVNSNKNSNTYIVYENTDLQDKTYDFIIDDKVKINIKPNEIKISKENIDYEYIINNEEKYISNNFISFSSIINMINSINQGIIEGSIKRVEVNENIIYKISLQSEYIKKIKSVDIIMSKSDEKMQKIKMYDLNNEELYFITFSSFEVKK